MRLRSALLAAPLLAAVACADDPPAAPPTASVEPNAHLIGRDGCQAPSILVLIAFTHTGRVRGETEREFIRARLIDLAGDNERAWTRYVALSGDVLAREAAGTLRDPPGALTAEQAAVRLVDLLYRCGGRQSIGDQLGDILEAGVDVIVTPVQPDQPVQVVVPSANFGVADPDGRFFDEPGLLALQRVPDDPPFVPGTYTEYPPRYQVTVLPASAQANFGRTPAPGDPTILVIICPSDPHPDLDDLTILRIPDAFPGEPAELLDAEHVHGYGVTCTEVDEYPGARIGAASSPGDRMLAALRRAGTAALGWLAPDPLYAVDGGIGGRPRLMSSFVAVARPPAEPTPSEDVIVINDMNLFDEQRMRHAGNRQFALNLVSFTGVGPRADETRVIFDRGRNAPCFVVTDECADVDQTTLDAVLTGAGFTITKYDDVRSYAEVPSDVKAIFLYTPRVVFTAADAAGLRQFAAEGGRIVFLGEHIRFYGNAGIAVQNDLLQQLGTGMTNVGARIDCSNRTLPASSLRPHQTTTGVESLVVSCLSRVVLGPDDYALLYSSTGSDVIGGVARIGTPAVAAARAAQSSVASARRDAMPRADAAPTVDGDGRPLARVPSEP